MTMNRIRRLRVVTCTPVCIVPLIAGLFLSHDLESRAYAAEPTTRPAVNAAPVPATPQEMAAARTDVWGEAAMQQPDGASYEIFADLLPPVRYVDAEFRYYPIVLSAPLSPQKIRLISNGSAINARANKKPMWKEVGVPVSFTVGDGGESFGQEITRLHGPRYAEGYLPIVRMSYTHDSTTYEQETFFPVDPKLAERGTVFVRLSALTVFVGLSDREPDKPRLSAVVKADEPLNVLDNVVLNTQGESLILFDKQWQWDASAKTLNANLAGAAPATLAILTSPAATTPALWLTPGAYDQHRQACVETWKRLLARGTQLETPEERVNNAWRSTIIGNFMIANGDRMNYSAINAYDHLYEGECGDATRSLLLFGYTDEARRMVGPLLDFQRKETRFHVAGQKLQLLADYFWTTRDANYLNEKHDVWKGVIDFIINSREPNGLLPPDRYAGDIGGAVYSLNSNANCWRGLHDMANILDEIGERDEARRIADSATEYKKVILDAVAKTERRDIKPPFMPLILLGNEEPHDPITGTRTGSYWNLMMPYVLGSGIFGHGSERERSILEYIQQRGGVSLGMIRSQPHQGQFAEQPGANVLYGLRYMLTLLRNDDREKALVGFYGQLAQAMTRDTFIGGEGSRFFHGDDFGRSFYLPPNSASNAMFLLTLRYLLVQDWDSDEDGRPDTLRLLYAVPRQWLRDGARLKLERAPTRFGEVSLELESRLSAGHVNVRVTAPPQSPQHVSLRAPLPAGWKCTRASVDGHALLLQNSTVDLSGKTGQFTVIFDVSSH